MTCGSTPSSPRIVTTVCRRSCGETCAPTRLLTRDPGTLRHGTPANAREQAVRAVGADEWEQAVTEAERDLPEPSNRPVESEGS